VPELFFEERVNIASELREMLRKVNEHAPPSKKLILL
jgi:hypothetical protein